MYLRRTAVWVYKILTRHLNGLVGFGKLDGIHQPLVACLTVGIRHSHQVGGLWRKNTSRHQQHKDNMIHLLAPLLWDILYLSCSFSEATQSFWGRSYALSKSRHISGLAVLRNTCHGLSQDLDTTKEQSHRTKREEEKEGCLGCKALWVWRVLGLFDMKAYLWVLHYALDAVEVGEVTDRLVGIIQHSSDGLKR